MAATYTKVFADPYPSGWKAKPNLSTPYLTSIRDNHDATLRALEGHLYDNPIPQTTGDLSDVDLTTAPTAGQILIWDDTANKFKPGNHTDLSQASIGDLSDVSISNADKVNGYVMTYESASGMIKLKEGGGSGGGKNYSTTEVEYGFDMNHNTVYAKTYREEYPLSAAISANMSTSINIPDWQFLDSVNILDAEGHVVFYPSTNHNEYECWTLPYYIYNSTTSGQKYFYIEKIIYSSAAFGSQATAVIRIVHPDGTSGGSIQYRKIKEWSVTFYYTKISTT